MILIIDSISFALSFGHIFCKSSNPGKNPSNSSLYLLPLASSRIFFTYDVNAYPSIASYRHSSLMYCSLTGALKLKGYF